MLNVRERGPGAERTYLRHGVLLRNPAVLTTVLIVLCGRFIAGPQRTPIFPLLLPVPLQKYDPQIGRTRGRPFLPSSGLWATSCARRCRQWPGERAEVRSGEGHEQAGGAQAVPPKRLKNMGLGGDVCGWVRKMVPKWRLGKWSQRLKTCVALAVELIWSHSHVAPRTFHKAKSRLLYATVMCAILQISQGHDPICHCEERGCD